MKPWQHLDFRTSDLQNYKITDLYCFKPLVCGPLLQLQCETKTRLHLKPLGLSILAGKK